MWHWSRARRFAEERPAWPPNPLVPVGPVEPTPPAATVRPYYRPQRAWGLVAACGALVLWLLMQWGRLQELAPAGPLGWGSVGLGLLGPVAGVAWAWQQHKMETHGYRRWLLYTASLSGVLSVGLAGDLLLRTWWVPVVLHVPLVGVPHPAAYRVYLARTSLWPLPGLLVGGWLYAVWATRAHPAWTTASLVMSRRHVRAWRSQRERQATAERLTGAGDVVICLDAQTGQPVVLREADRVMHVAVIGPTGSGKTQGALHPMVAQDLANPEVGITVIEPKGDWIGLPYHQTPPNRVPGVVAIAELYGRELYVLDPSREDSDVFNPLQGDLDVAAEVNAAALQTLFGEQEPFFKTVQEAVLKNLIKLLKHLHGDAATYLDLMYLLRDNDRLFDQVRELARRMRGTVTDPQRDDKGRLVAEAKVHGAIDETDPRYTLLTWFLHDYFGPDGEEIRRYALGLRMQLDVLFGNSYFLRCVVPRPGARTIDLDRHLLHKSVLAVSTNDGLLGNLSSVLGVLVATHLQYAIQRRASAEYIRQGWPKPLHALYMDEFAGYVNETFADFISKARGFNCTVTLGFQNLGQLERIANRQRPEGFRDTMLGQLRNKIIYGQLPPGDVEYFQRAFGVKQDWVVRESTTFQHGGVAVVPGAANVGMMRQQEEKPYLTYDDISYQAENGVIYQIIVDRVPQKPRKGLTRPVQRDQLPAAPPRPASPPPPPRLVDEAPPDSPAPQDVLHPDIDTLARVSEIATPADIILEDPFRVPRETAEPDPYDD